MKRKLVGEIDLYHDANIYYYPFSVKDEKKIETVYYIDKANQLKVFCNNIPFGSSLRFENQFLIAGASSGTLLVSKDNKYRILLERELQIKKWSLYKTAIISDYLFFCMDSIYSIENNTKCMELNLEEDSNVLLVLAPEKNIRVLLVHSEFSRVYYGIKIDIQRFEILSKKRMAYWGKFVKLADDLYAQISRRYGFDFYLFDNELNRVQAFRISGQVDDYEIDYTCCKVYVFMEDNKLYIIDYLNNNVIEQEIQTKINPNWNLEKICQGVAYFSVGKKSINCFHIQEDRLETLKFNDQVYCTFCENGIFFVLTAIEPDIDYKRDILINKGYIKIFSIS